MFYFIFVHHVKYIIITQTEIMNVYSKIYLIILLLFYICMFAVLLYFKHDKISNTCSIKNIKIASD